MAEWDAATYHRISDPQLGWGRTVAARLRPAPGERILDIGCGTGRLTDEIAATPARVVVGLDQSAAMLREARSRTVPCRAEAGIGSPAPHTPGSSPLSGMFATDDPPLTLDYWRLNISARKRAS